METTSSEWLWRTHLAKRFTGISTHGPDGRSVWYPSAIGPVEMESGIRYRIDVRDGQAHLTRLGHPFDV